MKLRKKKCVEDNESTTTDMKLTTFRNRTLIAGTIVFATLVTCASAKPARSEGKKSGIRAALKRVFQGEEESKWREYKAPNSKQQGMRVNEELLAKLQSKQTQVIVDISKQRAYLVADGEIVIDTPVSSARKGKYTPRGTFKITQRVRTGKRSTIYGCALPNWMRLNQSAYGLHTGQLPGYPASAGCVRLPDNAAKLIFSNTRRGTTVKITNSWTAKETLVAAN